MVGGRPAKPSFTSSNLVVTSNDSRSRKWSGIVVFHPFKVKTKVFLPLFAPRCRIATHGKRSENIPKSPVESPKIPSKSRKKVMKMVTDEGRFPLVLTGKIEDRLFGNRSKNGYLDRYPTIKQNYRTKSRIDCSIKRSEVVT